MMMVYIVLLLIFRLTSLYMLVMMVYIVLLLIFRLTPPYMLMMMVYIVTVTYLQVDSTVYVSDDGLYCVTVQYKPSSLTYTVEST
jgi:hypothetical protein